MVMPAGMVTEPQTKAKVPAHEPAPRGMGIGGVQRVKGPGLEVVGCAAGERARASHRIGEDPDTFVPIRRERVASSDAGKLSTAGPAAKRGAGAPFHDVLIRVLDAIAVFAHTVLNQHALCVGNNVVD